MELEIKKNNEFIYSNLIDALLVGGLSIIFFIGFHFFVPLNSNSSKLSWIMFYLSFLINYPHFMSSYYFLYVDYRKNILKDYRFFWAGILSPVLLIGLMIYLYSASISSNNPIKLGLMANILFFLVGHHYIKQIYGCVMVLSAKRKYYLETYFKYSLLALLYSAWMLSFLWSNSGPVYNHKFFNIRYQTLGIDPIYMQINYIISISSMILFLFFVIKKYLKENMLIPFNSILAIVSIFVWYIPSFNHAHFALMIPFFHSLQYLLFSNKFAINKAKQNLNFNIEKDRLIFIKKTLVFFIVIFLSGYLFWEFIPKQLDKLFIGQSIFEGTLFIFMFHIFLNIHHYFIDNVIWRKDNDQMRRFL